MKKESESSMFRLFLYVGLAWIGWKLLKAIVRAVSGADSLKQRREYGTVQGEGEKHRMEFKDVQDAEFTEVKDREQVSK